MLDAIAITALVAYAIYRFALVCVTCIVEWFEEREGEE